MKKGAVSFLLVFLVVIGIVFSQSNYNGKVDEEVEELLKEQDEVSVIVVLEDDYNALNEYSASALNEKDDFEKKKMMVKEQQEKVLSKLDYEEATIKKDAIEKNSLKTIKNNKIELKLKTKFNSVNGFSGEVFPHTWHGEFIEMSEEHEE